MISPSWCRPLSRTRTTASGRPISEATSATTAGRRHMVRIRRCSGPGHVLQRRAGRRHHVDEIERPPGAGCGRSQVARARLGPWFTTRWAGEALFTPGQGTDGRWRPAGQTARRPAGAADPERPQLSGKPWPLRGCSPALGQPNRRWAGSACQITRAGRRFGSRPGKSGKALHPAEAGRSAPAVRISRVPAPRACGAGSRSSSAGTVAAGPGGAAVGQEPGCGGAVGSAPARKPLAWAARRSAPSAAAQRAISAANAAAPASSPTHRPDLHQQFAYACSCQPVGGYAACFRGETPSEMERNGRPRRAVRRLRA